MSRSRTLSYSEITSALTCWAKWDFSYGGRLAGDTLRSRETAPILSDGRAWGAAVAAWHAESAQLFAPTAAGMALIQSLNADAVQMGERGFTVDPETLVDQGETLLAILDHYVATAQPLMGLERLEDEINVPVPARSGSRSSSLYRYQCFLDGHTVDDHPWIVEFKLRGALTPFELVEKAPQYRWYAWAYARAIGWHGPVGVYVDERLKEAPRPARIVKAKRKGEGVDGMTVSHAVDQVTTPELYEEACFKYGAFVDNEVLRSLRARQWQQRHPLIFTPDQLAEAGRELSGAAQVIRDLDAGRLQPIRHGSPMNCRGCRYKPICNDPRNEFAVNALFERTEPKRLRPAVAV